MDKDKVIKIFNKAICCENEPKEHCEHKYCEECEHYATRDEEIKAMKFVLDFFKGLKFDEVTNMEMRNFESKLKEGHTVAFDFDGVIHKYSKGWLDGSIYDEPNLQVLDLMLMLQLQGIPCVIISTREPEQIKEWWDKQGFTLEAKVLDFDTTFYNDCSGIGITNRKIPAQVYIDDRAYKYTDQTPQQFLLDFSEEITG